MQAYLIDYMDRFFELPVSLGFNISHGDSLPCDAFEICFVYDLSMYAMLCDAVRFKAVHEGETVFFGVVDEFEISLSEKGSVVTVCGRSLAALLLDNEAEAAQLYGAGLDFILEKYVYPYGISTVKSVVSPKGQQMVVGSGSSCWKVLEEFLWFGCGVLPRFAPDGTLILGEQNGKRLRIDGDLPAQKQVLKQKRYGVISHVLVKNKALGTAAVVENSDFINRGGNCRRVLNVPRYTRNDAMRATGEYQIRSSKREETKLSITVPALFAAFPGDVVELDYSTTGASGTFNVSRTNCFAWPDRAGTELVLTRREQ